MLTISELNLTVHEDEVGQAMIDIATLLEERGQQGFTLSMQQVFGPDFVPARRDTSIRACSECGTPNGLHALSCSRYSGPGSDPEASEPFERLDEFVLDELRRLPPSEWRSDSTDQVLPVVEIRQEHLAALLAEVLESRFGP